MLGWEKRISEKFVKDNVVSVEDKEIIEYGLWQGKILIMNLGIFLSLCTIFDAILQGILFLAMFWPLRIYAGGYHATTQKKCFLLSIGMELMLCAAMRYIVFDRVFAFILAVISFTVVIKIAPLENIHKPFDKEEKRVFRNMIKKIWLVEACVFSATYYLEYRKIFEVVIWVQLLMALLLIVEYLKQKNTITGYAD